MTVVAGGAPDFDRDGEGDGEVSERRVRVFDFDRKWVVSEIRVWN